MTKFEPMRGTPGKADYHTARLTYRIHVGGKAKVEFPTINFAVETTGGKLFERRFTLPAGSASLEPGDSIDRTVSLDPVASGDWNAAYDKADKAKFSWSVEGQGRGEIEKPVHKTWP
jgi:hypothetical protein